MYAKTKEKGHRYKGILIFATVVYDSMFEVKKYKCQLLQNNIKKIKSILSLLEKTSNNIKSAKIKDRWEFSTKKWLYDISAKQTAYTK